MNNIQSLFTLSSQIGLNHEDFVKNLLFSVLESSPFDVSPFLSQLVSALRPYGVIREDCVNAAAWLQDYHAGARSVFPKGCIKVDLSLIEHEIVSKAISSVRLESGVKSSAMAVLGCFSFLRKKSVGAGISANVTSDGFEGDLRFDARDVIPCGRVWLCPVCRRYILGIRAGEIMKATSQAVADGCKLYMLTLTAQHSSKTDIMDFRDRFKVAWKRFRHDRYFRQFWADNGSPVSGSGGASAPAMIENYECTFGEKTGMHLHRHILFIVRDDLDVDSVGDKMKSLWVRCCANSGLHAVEDAINFEKMRDGADYLAKLGWELTNSTYIKQGRKKGRIDYLGLCLASLGFGVGADGADAEVQKKRIAWAKKTLVQYVKMTYRLQCLHWSKGLKKLYNVADIEDEALIAESDKVEKFFVSRVAFLGLKCWEKKLLLTALNMGESSGLDVFGFNLFGADGRLVACGNEKMIESDKRAFGVWAVDHVAWCLQHGKKPNKLLIPWYEKATGKLLLLDDKT